MWREGSKANNKIQLSKDSALTRDSGRGAGDSTVPPRAPISPFLHCTSCWLRTLPAQPSSAVRVCSGIIVVNAILSTLPVVNSFEVQSCLGAGYYY